MNKTIENIAADYIQKNSLFRAKQLVLLAVSGGADSIGLLEILNQLNIAGKIKIKIHIAHINHQLRGADAAADEKFVIELAKKLSLPITVQNVDVKTFAAKNKLSIETAARKLRLKALSNIASENNCSIVATAHQKDDNAETILGRLLRGTGYTGLAGIWPKIQFDNKIFFVRPLLTLSRDQIENYLQSRNLIWQTDSTNSDCRFTRNHIRHKLIPLLQKECLEPLTDSLNSLAENCRQLSEQLKIKAETAWPDCDILSTEETVRIDSSKFLSLPRPVQIEIVRKALALLGCGEQKFTAGHYKKILDFTLSAQNHKTLTLPNNYTIYKERGTISVSKPQSLKPSAAEPVVINIPGRTRFDGWGIETEVLSASDCDIENFKRSKNNFVEWFDFDQIELPLIARSRVAGDRFWPFGGNNTKKIGKFLTATKITKEQRSDCFVITDAQKTIWLVPFRPSQPTAVGQKTSKVLSIEIFH